MKNILLFCLLVGLLAGCASPDLSGAASRLKTMEGRSHACLKAIEQAEKYDEQPSKRVAIDVALSAILGPISWPIKIARADAQAKEKESLSTQLESACSSPLTAP